MVKMGSCDKVLSQLYARPLIYCSCGLMLDLVSLQLHSEQIAYSNKTSCGFFFREQLRVLKCIGLVADLNGVKKSRHTVFYFAYLLLTYLLERDFSFFCQLQVV